MNLRRQMRGPLAAALVLVAVVTTHAQELPSLGSPQRRGDDETRSSGATTSIAVHSPEDTEVLQPERAGQPGMPTTPLPLETPIDPRTYVCGRGDVFELNFWGQQNFKLRVTVDPEGRTFVPKVGYIDVVGKTLADAREIAKKAVHRFYPGLQFDMSLMSPRSFLVHVVGYVAHPGLYAANPTERVSRIVAEAGDTSGSRRAIHIRRRNGATADADLVRYEETGDTRFNPTLMDGDVVDVPYPSLTVNVSGGVKRPGRYELIGSKDLAELLALAGGFSPSATLQRPLRLLRRDNGRNAAERAITVPPGGSPLPEVALADGDQLLVPAASDLQRSVLLVGPVRGATPADEVTAIRRLPFYEGATAGALIQSTGGLGATADLKGAYIRSESGAIEPLDLEALLVRRDFSADRAVHIGDTVVVPQKRHGVVVEGAVLKPALYPFNPRFTAKEYVATAGGPSKMAQSSSSYRILSPDGRTIRLTPSTLVQPGDTIVVPERTFSRSEIVQLVLGGAGLLLSTATLVYLIVK